MGLHIYYSNRKLLRITWGRAITQENLWKHFDLLALNDNYPRNLRIISSVDVDEIGFELTSSNMAKIAERRNEALEKYKSVYTAIYNLKPIPAAYLSFFSEFFDSPKSRIKQFTTEDAALSWLLGGVDPMELQSK